ncbi:MAG: D-Ala-D-Ala carboxypeptidase family metallohydrolase [Minisyncoccia bacterium]
MNLSEHFTLEEFTFTIHRNIDNTPTVDMVEQLSKTARSLERVRMLLQAPITVNSAYRSPELNKAVGGSPKSQHTKGQAVDFTAKAFGTPDQIVQAIYNSHIKFDQLIREYDRWVHISFSEKPRGEVLIIDKKGPRFYGT